MAFGKILVANRGEIAVRVCRTAHSLGYATVAVYSEADRHAPHVHAAEQACFIGPSAAADSYLNVDALIDAARRSGADAVHPGYGFLSEQAHFARACRNKDLVFIGPSPEAIETMGDKQKARDLLKASTVPLVPGYQGAAQDEETLVREAQEIGFPLMVKAASGGGGKGMRRVEKKEDLVEALAEARSEARNAFGDDRVILEKSIASPRHVEIQVVIDRFGNAVHLGERDCSVQRRFQKIVEEAPSPALDRNLREKMGAAALAVAHAARYEGVGTVEFLLDEEGEFYFLEMNTRLQVEHAVTEMVTGLDLVALQLKIAAGEPLGLEQNGIKHKGHALEVRLYAEDPNRDFLPCTGKILKWQAPDLTGVRTDHALAAGEEITAYYDPMMAKIVARGCDRSSAIRLLRRALDETVCFGLTHNLEFLGTVLDHPVFQAGEATTAFVHAELSDRQGLDTLLEMWLLAAVLFYQTSADQYPPSLQGFCNTEMLSPVFILRHEDEQKQIRVHARGDNKYALEMDQKQFNLELISRDGDRVSFVVDGSPRSAAYASSNHHLHMKMNNKTRMFHNDTLAPPTGTDESNHSENRIIAAMSGRVVSVTAVPGASVEAGSTLVVLESMKMQHRLATQVNGVVRSIHVAVDQQVSNGDVLVELDAEETV